MAGRGCRRLLQPSWRFRIFLLTRRRSSDAGMPVLTKKAQRSRAFLPSCFTNGGRWEEDLQCAGRGHRHQTGLSRGVPAAALSGASGQFLRMEKDAGRQAALCDRTQGQPADGDGRIVETWRSPEGERIRSFTIATTKPNQRVDGRLSRRNIRTSRRPRWRPMAAILTAEDVVRHIAAEYALSTSVVASVSGSNRRLRSCGSTESNPHRY